MSLSEEINAQSAEILELSENEGISQISYNDLVQSKLREKYDALVTGMLEKVEIENKAYMDRKLDGMEKDVIKESERLEAAFRAQTNFETLSTASLEGIISTLRKSWEEEEVARSKRLEDRLRGHYSVILEHMEAQLQMALQLQDEADKQWMKDVEMRNAQQIKMMNSFEKKCRKLYETRLIEYTERSDEQLNQYNSQLLHIGGAIAMERSRVESHKRRLKMACYQWKVQYLRNAEQRYHELSDNLESKYLSELYRVTEDPSMRNQNYAGNNSGSAASHLPSGKDIATRLKSKFDALSLSPEARCALMYELVEGSVPDSHMVSGYEALLQKLEARSVISNKLERKKYLLYKLKLAKQSAKATSGDVQSKLEIRELTTELEQVQSQMDELYANYEHFHGEPYHILEKVS